MRHGRRCRFNKTEAACFLLLIKSKSETKVVLSSELHIRLPPFLCEATLYFEQKKENIDLPTLRLCTETQYNATLACLDAITNKNNQIRMISTAKPSAPPADLFNFKVVDINGHVRVGQSLEAAAAARAVPALQPEKSPECFQHGFQRQNFCLSQSST